MKDWQLVVVSAIGGTIGAVATAAFMERRRNQFFADLERQSRQIEDLAVKQTQRPRPPAPSTARHALRDDDITTTTTATTSALYDPTTTLPRYAPDAFDGRIDGGPERSWSPHRDADSSDVAGASERGLQNDYGSTGSDSSGSDGGGGGGSD